MAGEDIEVLFQGPDCNNLQQLLALVLVLDALDLELETFEYLPLSGKAI